MSESEADSELSSSKTGNSDLLCIEYPGIVNDVSKAVESLGGMENVCRVNRDNSRRLELRFRPEDAYCKPTCGEKVRETSFLLKVKRKRKGQFP